MRKFLRNAWVVICLATLAVYLLSCLTPVIKPSSFSFISLLAIAFPYLFLAAFTICFIQFFVHKKWFAVMLCVVVLAGFKNLRNSFGINTQAWQMAKDSSTLRILTWNVESFTNSYAQSNPESKSRVDMLSAINEYKPEVLCMQEYTDVYRPSKSYASVKKELDSLGYIYSFVSNDSVITRYSPTLIFKGVSIFSKLPLTDSSRTMIKERKGEQEPENFIYADVLWRNKKIRVCTAHLLSFRLFTDTLQTKGENIYKIAYDRKRRFQYKLRETELMHEKQVRLIKSIINQSPYPVIYCGDINSTPASYTYNFLRGSLQDAFVEKGAGLGGTFYKLGKALRIDVCLPDNAFKVQQCTVPQLYLSDHFPVVADVAWK